MATQTSVRDGVLENRAFADNSEATSDRQGEPEETAVETLCSHINCLHGPAFAGGAGNHEFFLANCAEPRIDAQLYWPTPPLRAAFRPPIYS